MLTKQERNSLQFTEEQAIMISVTEKLFELGNLELLTQVHSTIWKIYNDSLSETSKKEVDDRLKKGLLPGGEFY